MIDLYGTLRLGMLPAHAARFWGEREALVFAGERWTFAALDREVDRIAWGLMRAGIEPGEKVGLWFTNRPEYLFLLFAVTKIGAIAVPLNTRYRTQDIRYCVRQSDCAALVYAEKSGPIDYGRMVEDALGEAGQGSDGRLDSAAFPMLKRLIVLGPRTFAFAEGLEELVEAAGPIDHDRLRDRALVVDPDDVAMIVYTSGTTGEAKGVMLTHAGVRLCVQRSVIWGTNREDRQLHYLPLFHLYALGFVTIPSVALGVCQILMETFDGEAALRLIEAEQATIIHGFDPHYRDIIAAQERLNLDISSLRMGSFPSGPDNCIPIIREANAKLCPIYPSFGMTETWSGITAGFLDCSLEQRAEASGFPLPGVEIKIVDPETGQEQPPLTQGEILVRSFSLMRGYYRMPEDTAKALDGEGFLHTGDAGYLRPDGYIRFTGRYKDMLKVGGENVAPAEVELLLSELPGVADVAVVGYPDLRLQEVAAAFVILAPNAEPIGLDLISDHCRGRVASFKIPRQLFLVDEFPMTPSGKVQKGKLRDAAQAHYEAARRGEALAS
ncbi:AMP-binding protein [Bosea sp. (in: a-proteobacteria)]|uniref:AMP-binding protein n=1 Tax=Bosea sp. (in: a-proteobacteria) TaxID=1871050 RepID=UPI00333EBEBB